MQLLLYALARVFLRRHILFWMHAVTTWHIVYFANSTNRSAKGSYQSLILRRVCCYLVMPLMQYTSTFCF